MVSFSFVCFLSLRDSLEHFPVTTRAMTCFSFFILFLFSFLDKIGGSHLIIYPQKLGPLR